MCCSEEQRNLIALVAEYRALPDDLNTRLNWPGYARLPHYITTCLECGRVCKHGVVGLEELVWAVDHNRFDFAYKAVCEECEPTEDDDDDEDDEVMER